MHGYRVARVVSLPTSLNYPLGLPVGVQLQQEGVRPPACRLQHATPAGTEGRGMREPAGDEHRVRFHRHGRVRRRNPQPHLQNIVNSD